MNIEVIASGSSPKLGDIKRAHEIGFKGGANYIWHSCVYCGKERWVQLCATGPTNQRCRSCINIGRKPSEEINRKRSYALTGEKNHKWKGGRVSDGSGYILIWVHPEDFFHQMANRHNQIPEHRLVMAKHLGRCLQSWEIVHHKNGIRYDNRLENLELMTKNSHHKNHSKGYRDGYTKGYYDGANKHIEELEAEVARLSILCQQQQG